MSAQANKALILRWFEEANRGNADFADEVFSPQYVMHAPRIPPRPAGVEGVKHSIRESAEYCSYYHTTIKHIVTEDDLVVVYFTATSILQKDYEHPLFGTIKPNAKEVSAEVVFIYRFENGKVVEAFGVADELGNLLAMGVIQPSLKS